MLLVASNSQAKDGNNAVHGFVLPPHRAGAVSWVIPVTRTCRVQTSPVLLHYHTSYCIEEINWDFNKLLDQSFWDSKSFNLEHPLVCRKIGFYTSWFSVPTWNPSASFSFSLLSSLREAFKMVSLAFSLDFNFLIFQILDF